MRWPREIGCFMCSWSGNNLSKTLTSLLLFTVFFTPSAFSSILVEEKFNTHLRWNLFVDKKDVLITKTGLGLYIETFRLPLYKKLKNKLNTMGIQQGHFSQILFNTEGFPQKPARIRVDLKDENVELFSFYRPQDKKYVLDFWKSGGQEEKVVAATERQAPETVTKKSPPIAPPPPKQESVRDPKKEYRDFRYGAALIWDYPAIAPKIEQKINIERKTPEYFYPVEDRNIEKKDDKEAHLQLSINLYRKGKYGLMYKSIGLYRKKYGRDGSDELNEYLRALALIRENFKHPEKGPFKSALAIFAGITERSKEYALKRAIYLYHIQYLLQQKNMIETLQLGKKLYVESKVESDKQTLDYAAQVIFHTLSQLGQVEKISKFAGEKSVKKLVAPQTIFAYQVFVHHREGDMDKVIGLFERNRPQMASPIDPSILYNVSEAYFRKSRYKKAIGIYRKLLENYRYMNESSFARVRLALSYELLESHFDKTLELYEDAINRASNSEALHEAKLRYVAMRNTRKIRPKEEDRKVLSLLEYSNNERATMNDDLRTLLWLVRLRIFINSGDYRKALSYITALPLKTLRPTVKRMFEGDGAEIVYGMIVQSFERGEAARVVKLWEIYRDIYESKVAGRPYLNFVVAQSYIALGLGESLQRVMANLQKIREVPLRTFPLWVPRVEYGTIDNLMAEINLLKMLRQKKWEYVIKNVDQLNISQERKLFYEVLAFYHSKYFDQAIKAGEEFLRKSPKVIPLNKTETHRFFEAYLESLYASANLEKFKKVATAVLQDIERIKTSHEGLNNLSEKTEYLLIESLAGSTDAKDRLQVEAHIKNFLANHNKSIYMDRVQFLLASTFINHQKKPAGLKILNELVAAEGTSSYIKEISRTEIARLKLDEKIIN